MALAEKIQILRQEKGLSQEQLAERLGVSRQSVSKWETGQSRPDMDKLVVLAELFGVSADYLIREEEKTFGKHWAMAVLVCVLVVAAAAVVWLGIQNRQMQEGMAALKETNVALEQTKQQLNADLQAVQQLPNQLPSFEQLEDYYYRFAQTYRLDYIPSFTEGNAPTESPEYLFWAFALNLDNWGEQKGSMSKEYVDDVVRTYFGISGIAHLSLWKSWDFDGQTYTAIPGGVNPLPVYLLHSFQVYVQDGQTCYEIVLDLCNHREGIAVDPAELDTLEKLWTEYRRSEFVPARREKLVYTLSSTSGRPVFLAHEITAGGDTMQATK